MRKLKRVPSIIEFPLIAFGFLAIWFQTFQHFGFFDSYFSVIDDPIIVDLHAKFVASGSFFSTSLEYIREHLAIRFRPAWSAYICVLTRGLGMNHPAWMMTQAIVTTVYSTLLYACLRNLTVNPLLACAVVFASLIGDQFTVFWRLANCDSIGLIFMLSATLLMIRNARSRGHHPILIFVFTLLMSLSKESYVVAMPAIAAGYLYSFRFRDGAPIAQILRERAPFVAGMAAVCLAEVLYIRSAYSGEGVVISIALALNNLSTFFVATRAVSVLVIAGLAGLIFRRVRSDSNRESSWDWEELLLVSLILLALFVPQAVLYGNAGFYGRYLYPAIFSLFGFLAYLSVRLFSANTARWGFSLVAAWVLLHGVEQNWKEFRAQSVAWATMGKSVKEVLDLARQIPPDGKVLIVADPGYNHEHLYALRNYLQSEGIRHVYFDLIPKAKYEGKMYNYKALADENLRLLANDSLAQAGDPRKIAAIFVISVQEEFRSQARDWLELSRYQLGTHPGAVSFYSYLLKESN